MKGLSQDNCYFIDHFFYYPNVYGSHDGCDIYQLLKVASDEKNNRMTQNAAIELKHLLERSEPGEIGDMKYCHIFWEWKRYTHVPVKPTKKEEEKDGIQNFIEHCRKNRLQRLKNVV